MKNKHAVSIMIGYVLLVSIAMIIGAVTYAWMKTYVPADKVECAEGVSLYIKNINCTKYGGDIYLDVTLKNSGRFSIAGYYAYISETEDEKATIDLSDYLREDSQGKSAPGVRAIYFTLSTDKKNSFSPDEEITHSFFIDDLIDLKNIEILPARIEEVKGKEKFAVCSSSKVREEIFCS